MLALIQHYAVTLSICVALGAGTAWWMFRGERRDRSDKE